jgi:hypothetical protein
VNLNSRPQVLQLWEGEEEMWGKIKHMEEPQRWHSQERAVAAAFSFKTGEGVVLRRLSSHKRTRGEGRGVV